MRRASKTAGAVFKPKRTSLLSWWKHHGLSAHGSALRIIQAPLGNLMTIMVIAIALALPSGLQVLISNIEGLTGGWQVSSQISVFMRHDIDAEQTDAIAEDLRRRDDVNRVDIITPEQALAEFQAHSGFAEALQTLESNPLPSVITVTPSAQATRDGRVGELQTHLASLNGVDNAQLDRNWLDRLAVIIQLAHRSILVIGTLLLIAVLLIVVNTIRLDIENRRQEIEIAKLIGATNAFVRRPFLYTGLWYGLCGAIIAVILVNIAVALLYGPASTLARLYGSSASPDFLGPVASLGLLLLGSILGLIGSFISVSRHLRAVEPS
ncbi:MAG TPA: cell division protein FtsX [Chromatiaceae bacterium]|jgi:cell division transport system permease protein|nr:cell division protein FtsX [Chromatiaceae bacterium]HIA08287.1 cell division protein FtsX [Chromatiaceae bacterium]HIO55191.1 cell division protein FtsX [Chromatiales bacterium]